jgi:hypothetical protein
MMENTSRFVTVVGIWYYRSKRRFGLFKNTKSRTTPRLTDEHFQGDLRIGLLYRAVS